MRLVPVLIGLGTGLTALSTPVLAAYVDIETVRIMAFDHGIVKLEEVELQRRKGIWTVEGKDAYGKEIDMKVDARTGRIIKLERD